MEIPLLFILESAYPDILDSLMACFLNKAIVQCNCKAVAQMLLIGAIVTLWGECILLSPQPAAQTSCVSLGLRAFSPYCLLRCLWNVFSCGPCGCRQDTPLVGTYPVPCRLPAHTTEEWTLVDSWTLVTSTGRWRAKKQISSGNATTGLNQIPLLHSTRSVMKDGT